MPDRWTALRELAAAVTGHPRVADAWLAKRFTDRLFVVELDDGDALPGAIEAELRAAGLEPCDELHDVPAEAAAFAGDLDGTSRFRFVDVVSRGSLQSYLVEWRLGVRFTVS